MPSTSNPPAAYLRRRDRDAGAPRLPQPYRTTMRALVRYVTKTGANDDARRLRMVRDLADLFERAAADQVPLADLLGDPVEFADDFKANYGPQSRVLREQRRLTRVMGRVTERQAS